MKERIKNLYQFILLCFIATLFSACGGSNDEVVSYSISADISSINFSNEIFEASNHSIQIDVTFTGNNLLLGYAPGAVPSLISFDNGATTSSWLDFRTENVTSNSATIILDVQHEDILAPNLYETIIRISTGDVDDINLVHHDIDVSLLIWQLATSTELVSYRGTLGDASIAEQTFTLSSIENQWTATTDVDWLTLNISEGTGTSDIIVTPNITNLTSSQLYQGNIVLTEVTSGDSKMLPVELGLDDIRLSASYPALAFNSLATQNTLTHTVDIFNNGVNPISWQASTSANWLTLIEDLENNKLTITADPSQLSSNGLHEAEVTLSATTEGEAVSGTVAININKGDTDSEEVLVNDVVINNSGTVLDPKRPYLYTAQADKVVIYNIIDGSIFHTIDSPMAGLDLTNLVVHPDGSLLLASNLETYTENDEEKTRVNHFKILLPDFSITQMDNETITIDYRPEAIVMVSGKPVVITQAQEVADMSLVRHYFDFQNYFLSATISDVKSNNLVHAFDAGSSAIKQYQLSYNAYATQTTAIDSTISYDNELFGNLIGNIATNSDGSVIYTANLNSEWSTYDGELFTDQGLLHGDTISAVYATGTDSEDNSYFYRSNETVGFTYSKYDKNQQLLWEEVHINGFTNVYIATDFQRLITYNSQTSVLIFNPTP